MFSNFKEFVRRKFRNHEAVLANHEDRISNIENRGIQVFVDHESGIVYDRKFGVTLPVMREVVNTCGGSGGFGGFNLGREFRMVTVRVELKPGAIVAMGGNGSNEKPPMKLEQCGEWTFHKDRVPKCDYVMFTGGTMRFFKKAPKVAVPADAEVTASGKVIKSKKK